MMLRWHPQFMSSSLLVGSALLLTGCFSYLSEERIGSPGVQAVPYPERSVGTARIAVLPHNDGLGWSISAERMAVQETVTVTSQDWMGRRYVFSPLSIIAGIVQCPIGLLSIFDQQPNNKDGRYGCARLMMMEPLDGQVKLPPTQSFDIVRTKEWRPLKDGVIDLDWTRDSAEPITYALGHVGKVDVRLVHLLGPMRGAPPPATSESTPLRIRLRYDDGTSVDQDISVSSAQLTQAFNALAVPITPDRWPSVLIMQVKVEPATASDHEIQHSLTSWIVQQGFCAVVDEVLHAALLDEQNIQHTSSPDNQLPVKPGRLLSPNIVLRASSSARKDGPDETKDIALHLIDHQEGKVIAISHAATKTRVIKNPLDRALSDLEIITRHAPRRGCPLKTS